MIGKCTLLMKFKRSSVLVGASEAIAFWRKCGVAFHSCCREIIEGANGIAFSIIFVQAGMVACGIEI